jgi:hypothetical protein
MTPEHRSSSQYEVRLLHSFLNAGREGPCSTAKARATVVALRDDARGDEAPTMRGEGR